MENLNTRSMIFTLYGDYVRHYGGEIWIGSLIELLKEFGHNEQSVRAAISRMNKQGWVRSRRKGNRSYYFLTDIGVERMEEAAQRIFKLKPNVWDGKWRILIYSIPEEKRHIRDELRKELVWSGFGSLANSMWISPNNLTKQVYILMDKYQIRSHIHYFIAEYDGPHKNKQLVSACWDLSSINEKYERFIQIYGEKFKNDKQRIRAGLKTEAECFVERTKLVHEYRKFLFIDPGLPDELLPDHWLGHLAQSLFTEYYKWMAEPASRFFERIYKKGSGKVNKNKDYDILHHPLMTDEG